MRRVLLISLLLCIAAPAAAAQAAVVKLTDCTPALAPQDRTATFAARVRAAHGSDRMAVRFTLQEREGGLAAWRRVDVPGWSAWLTSEPGVGRYAYDKTIANLSAPASYRVVVRFRWLDIDGAVIARTRATSRACRQPDMRPDLRPSWITVVPSLDGMSARYAVAVRNGGRTAAAPSTLALAVASTALAPAAVPALAPGERVVMRFAGPPCAPGDAIVATADAGAAVDERDEADNLLQVDCPA
jgi:hypothetical protein